MQASNHRRSRRRHGYAMALVAEERRQAQLMAQALGFAGLALLAIPALYLAKSAAGIDLLPGPSPLHDLLYHLLPR